jgi:hypothetical protein
MEISEKIITEAFSNIETATNHDRLKALLENLDNHSIESILFKEDEDLRKNSQTIYEILSTYLPSFFSDNQTSKQTLSSILLTIKKYFDKALSNGDVKSLLIFLSVNCYLKIDINHFITEEIDTTKLTDRLIKVLESVKLETKLKPGAPYHEKELKATSVEGINEQNIEKIYHLILSIERGERGFHFNFLLENLIFFFFQFDTDQFVKHLDSLTHPETVVFYLQSFSENSLIQISNSYNHKNQWVHFELIRQIIEKEGEDYNVNSSSIQSIIKSLESLHDHNIAIYKQAIIFFHRSKIFNSALGYQMKDLIEEEILEIFNSIIPFDKYNSNLEQRTIFLEEFSKGVSEEVYHKGLKTVFNRWKDLCTSIAESEDSYQSDVLLTDFANFVVQYYIHLDEKEIIYLINSSLNNLIWINSEWFLNQSQQITKYHLYLTEVYFLSYAYKNKKLSNPETLVLIDQLKNYRQYEEKRIINNVDPLPIIEDNINWSTTLE